MEIFDLWRSLSSSERAAAISTLVLTLGALIEYRHGLKQIIRLSLKCLILCSTPFERCALRKLVIHSIGPLLVVVGIGGELIFGTISVIESDSSLAVLQGNNKQLGIDLINARSALVGIQNELEQTQYDDAVGLEKERQATAGFQKEAAAAQLALSRQITAQGPWAKLIVKAAPELVSKLAPFAGQRVSLFVCGQLGVAEQETVDTWGAIANILDSDTVAGITGAKWKEVPTNLNWAGNSGAAKGLGQGVAVFVSKRASKGTMEAAAVLARGLAKTLPPSPNKMLLIQDPDFVKVTIDRRFQRSDSPWAAAALDPELVTVLIGEHP